jgi:hypothetical protein
MRAYVDVKFKRTTDYRYGVGCIEGHVCQNNTNVHGVTHALSEYYFVPTTDSEGSVKDFPASIAKVLAMGDTLFSFGASTYESASLSKDVASLWVRIAPNYVSVAVEAHER